FRKPDRGHTSMYHALRNELACRRTRLGGDPCLFDQIQRQVQVAALSFGWVRVHAPLERATAGLYFAPEGSFFRTTERRAFLGHLSPVTFQSCAGLLRRPRKAGLHVQSHAGHAFTLNGQEIAEVALL